MYFEPSWTHFFVLNDSELWQDPVNYDMPQVSHDRSENAQEIPYKHKSATMSPSNLCKFDEPKVSLDKPQLVTISPKELLEIGERN